MKEFIIQAKYVRRKLPNLSKGVRRLYVEYILRYYLQDGKYRYIPQGVSN